MEKLRLKLSYDFDVTMDMLDYLEDTFGVKSISEASSEQYEAALSHVIKFYSDKNSVKDFISYVAASVTPVNINDGFRHPNRDFFTFSVNKTDAYQEW